MSVATVPPPSPTAVGPLVRVDDVSRVFGHGNRAVVALDHLTLHVAPGELVCVVGASGCGKTTLLHMLAGLDHPTTGTIEVGGTRTAMLFQEAALLPWLTAVANVELPMRLQGVPKRERRSRAMALLEKVRLAEFAGRQPFELSGGMRQRVALARALAEEPDVLLMDEPVAALDAMTRDLLHDELERLWSETGKTLLFVTHNVREAVRLGDRVVVLTSRPGRVAVEVPVELPRPRRLESPAVAMLAGEVTRALARRGPPPLPLRCFPAPPSRTSSPVSTPSSKRTWPRRRRCSGHGPGRRRGPSWPPPASCSWSGSWSCGRAGGPGSCSPARPTCSPCCGTSSARPSSGAR
jgi:NitT/TauT family transport system ATP-binding protein